MIYFCCDDERRRNAVKAHPTLNGIDFLEVRDEVTDPLEQRQRTLLVHFLKDLTPRIASATGATNCESKAASASGTSRSQGKR